MSYGPLLFGHMPKAVASAIRKALARGTSYGAPCRAEVELAERVCAARPVDGEGPLRLLRHRGRDERGAPRARRHGARPRPEVRRAATTATPTPSSSPAGSGVATLGIPGSPGVPADLAKRDAHGAVQRPRRPSRRSSRSTRARSPSSPSSPSPRTWASSCRSRASSRGSGRSRTARRRSSSSTRSSPASASPAAGRRRSSASSPTSPASGRSSAAGLPVGAYGGRADLMALRRPRRARLPGGDPLGEPARHGGGHRDARLPHPRGLRQAREDRLEAREGDAEGREGSRLRRAPHAQPDRLHPDPLLQRRARSPTSTT